jgi:hypothetical protein
MDYVLNGQGMILRYLNGRIPVVIPIADENCLATPFVEKASSVQSTTAYSMPGRFHDAWQRLFSNRIHAEFPGTPLLGTRPVCENAQSTAACLGHQTY